MIDRLAKKVIKMHLQNITSFTLLRDASIKVLQLIGNVQMAIANTIAVMVE